MPANSPSPRLQPLVALAAVRELLRNKEDTSQVFRILKALSGRSHARSFQRFLKSDLGPRLLHERRDLLATLSDWEWLSRLPEASLGRTYLEFVQSQNISAQGLAEASLKEKQDDLPEDELWFSCRLREMHDLWHVVTGYGRDGFGEACIVAYSYPQTGNIGFALISVAAALEFNKLFPGRGIWKAIWEAYRLGHKTAWLPGADWEALLPQPLETVRQHLKIVPPRQYLAAPEVIAGTMPAALGSIPTPA